MYPVRRLMYPVGRSGCYFGAGFRFPSGGGAGPGPWIRTLDEGSKVEFDVVTDNGRSSAANVSAPGGDPSSPLPPSVVHKWPKRTSLLAGSILTVLVVFFCNTTGQGFQI